MRFIKILIREEKFTAEFQDGLAPGTCSWFRTLLPWRQRLIHARWSGEACWIPLGNLSTSIGPENATSYPRPGEILFYPGDISEAELLVGYGAARFASKAGQLAGNPLLLITEKLDRLAQIGREVLWSGAVEICFTSDEASE